MANEQNLNKDPNVARERGKLGGRPKGSKNYKTRLKELLAGISEDKEWTSPLAAEKIQIAFGKYDHDDKDGKYKKGDYRYPVHERQRALNDMIEQLAGKPKQSVGVASDGEIILRILKETVGKDTKD
jgi:hypothetical protein